ncbi:MAG TPA: hypothetical protein VKQ72_00205, partial [Aggregatilineales bacterium]|nr:hypothetical protein [Aggregatilineales bacterium]
MRTLAIFASATLLLAVPAQSGAAPVPPSPLHSVIPMPVFVSATGSNFTLTADADIYVEPATPEIEAIGQFLAD